MADKNITLQDISTNGLYPVTKTTNVYNSNNESLDNILAGKVGFTQTTLGGTSTNPLDAYYDKTQIDNFNTNKANKSLDNITPVITSRSLMINSKNGKKYTGIHICVESWRSDDGTLWYKKYNDGFIKCGGTLASVPTDTTTEVELPITFSTINYFVFVQSLGSKRNSTQYTNGQSIQEKKNSSFILRTDDYSYGRDWYAFGY